jgi:hypothetical protein
MKRTINDARRSLSGDLNHLMGWINLRARTTSVTLTLPLGVGGPRFTFNALAAAPCL